MFDKMLIANRGEIACRIIRTARRLKVKTVAVYSTIDSEALHVSMADEAIAIGPAPANESYLLIERIIAAANASAAEAIHPGYGFLSENPELARSCADNDMIFIGPTAAAISAMGSKSTAKTIMTEAGVPLLPGYHGDNQDPAWLQKQADNMTYPVLIKAAAGGGGKGMRVVMQRSAFAAALAAAKREAMNAFNDETVLIEKYLRQPRHIEIQIFRDTHGNGVYLFERDCSMQRRYQKILEEAPAPGMQAERRQMMGQAALKAAEAIGYTGAGTVEFIVDTDENFYFMEMNTRLQVEHPVTEMISGQDLVEWQLGVAAGRPLPLRQDALAIRGHAMEARIYAEDAANDFLPCTGQITHLRFPSESACVRIDTGVQQGDAVSVFYDPMLAKLIVWAEDRPDCLARMQTALAATQIVGLKTNLDFLQAALAHPVLQAGEVTTGFVAEHAGELLKAMYAQKATAAVYQLAALYLMLVHQQHSMARAAASAEPDSPWHLADGWLLNLTSREAITLRAGSTEKTIQLQPADSGFIIRLDNTDTEAAGQLEEQTRLTARLGNRRLQADVIRDKQRLVIFHAGQRYELERLTDAYETPAEEDGGRLLSPMPGKIIAILTAKDQAVSKGDPLLILEAMKMEHTITANQAGTVVDIFFAENDRVDAGVELLTIA